MRLTWISALVMMVGMSGNAWAAHAKRTDGKAADAKAADAKAADAKAGGAKPTDAEAADGKPADAPAAGSDGAEAAAEPEIPYLEGPQKVDLGHQIEIDLPAGAILLQQREAQQILRSQGADVDSVLAMVGKEEADWRIIIEHDDIGHVTDDDAGELDADELLESYREGTLAQNAERRKLGADELFVDAWSERPRYDRSQRQLLWGLRGHASDGPFVNYFTRVLGRDSVISINLISDPAQLETAKKEALDIIQATRFRTGARYEDFDAKTDHSSGLGLRALVLGGAGIATVKAAKAGLLIKLLLVFKKGLIAIGIAIAGFFRWLTGRSKKRDAAEAEAAAASSADAAAPPPDGE